MITPYGSNGNGLADLDAYKAANSGARPLPKFPEVTGKASLVDLAFLALGLMKLK